MADKETTERLYREWCESAQKLLRQIVEASDAERG